MEDQSSQNTKNFINVAWKVFEQYIVENLHIRLSCLQDMSAESLKLVPVLGNFTATFEIETKCKENNFNTLRTTEEI